VFEHHNEQADVAASTQQKPQWIRPEVDRLIAGGAEGNAGNDVEGLDGVS
jgi:hypothetical protein